MGDGKKLKVYIDKKGTNVSKLARATNISSSTIYNIINRDSKIRYDFALRFANVLEIEVFEICSYIPYPNKKIEDYMMKQLPNDLKEKIDIDIIIQFIIKNIFPLIINFDNEGLLEIKNILTTFYKLDDKARKEIIDYMNYKKLKKAPSY